MRMSFSLSLLSMIISFFCLFLFLLCVPPSRATFDPASLIYDQSFDVPPSPSQIHLWPEFGRTRTDERVDTCGWVPNAVDDLSLPSTAAFRSNGNCYLNFSSVPFTPDMTVRLNFRLTSVPPHRSVLFTLGSEFGDIKVPGTVKESGRTETIAGGFNLPYYALSSPDQRYMYVSDYQDHIITRIAISNRNDRTIVAGQKGVGGYAEGPLGTNLLSRPVYLAFDDRNSSILYFSESTVFINNPIRKLVLSTKVTSLVASVNVPSNGAVTGMVFVQNSLYVAAPSLFCKIDLTINNYGRVSVVEAAIGRGYGFTKSPNGLFLFFADRDSHRIKRLELSTNQVTTVAGSLAGYRDGAVGAALFSRPSGVATDDVGQSLYVADRDNHCIRRISFCSNGNQYVETFAGSGLPGSTDGLGTDALFSSPVSLSYQPNFTGTPYLLVVDSGNKAIRRIAVPAVPSALCSSTTTTNNNHVEISVAGSSELMAVSDRSETTLQIRVNNQGVSCESLPRGCQMDLPGFVQIGVWMDLMITFESSGVSSLYLNGTLVASNYVMRRPSLSSYQHVLLGTSLKSVEKGRSRIDFVNSDRSHIGLGIFDMAEFDLRRFSIFNTSLSSYDIASLYFDTSLSSSYSYSISASGYATLDQMEPIRSNFIKRAVPFVLDFSEPKKGFEIDVVTGDYLGVPVGSVVDTRMDALGSVGFNAAIITNPGPSNHIRLSPKMIGGEFSLQILFKITAQSASTCTQTHTLFSCSALDIAGKARSIDSILITVTPTSASACQLSSSIYQNPTSLNVTLAIQHGVYQWSNLTVDTGASLAGVNAQKLSLDVTNLLFTINMAGVAKVYHHGILIATASNMMVPFPRLRHHCAVGGTLNETSTSSSEATGTLLAIGRVAYWPSTKSASEISQMKMIDNAIPFSEWSSQSFIFNRKPPTAVESYARGAAVWSGTLPFRPPVLNNTFSTRPGYQVNGNGGGYLSFGFTSFGGECTIAMTVDFDTLWASRTIVEFSNGRPSSGEDTVVFRTGNNFKQDGVNVTHADLVIDVSVGGVWNPAGPVIIYGALRLFITHTIVAVFRKETLTVYINGVPLLIAASMQAPPMVERPYTLASRSLIMNPDHRNSNIRMRIFALDLISKPLTETEVLQISPSALTSFSVAFLNPYSNIEQHLEINSPYPIFHSCNVSLNPFQQRAGLGDGTIVGAVVQQPTPGVFFDSPSGVSQPQFIEIGPTLIGGRFTLRLKFQVRSSFTLTQWMPILELSNGRYIDPIMIHVTGSPASRRVRLTIGGCSSSPASSDSAAIDASQFWIDLIITVSLDGVVKFYSWGKLISQSTIQCLPRPVRRASGVLGYSQTSAEYFKNGAIGLFSIGPEIIDRVTMDSIYSNDHPIVQKTFIPTPWVVEVPWNKRHEHNLPGTVVAHSWLLDTAGPGPDRIYKENDKTTWGSYKSYLDIGDNRHCFEDKEDHIMPQCTFARLSLANDKTARIRTLNKPVFQSGEIVPVNSMYTLNFITPPMIGERATTNAFLFDDAPYASAEGAYIGIIKYFEPIVLVVPRQDVYTSTQNCDHNVPAGDVCPARIQEDHWLESYKKTPETISYDMVNVCGKNGLTRKCANNLLFDTDELRGLDEAEMYRYYLTGLFQLPPYPEKSHDFSPFKHTLHCYHTFGACSDRTGGNPEKCSCSLDSHNIIVIPPTFRFQYGSAQSSILRPTLEELSARSPIPTEQTANAGNRFHYSYTNNDVKKPLEFKLGTGERIIKVDTVCNYRFTFTTNLGRELVIGSHPIFDKVDICPPSVLHEEFYGFDRLSDNRNQMTIDDLIGTGGKSAIVADKLYTTLRSLYSEKSEKSTKTPSTLINPVRQTWSKPGHSLSFMQGTVDGAYAYRFMWVASPVSYRMYNFQFEISAAELVSGGQPGSAIVVDLYNNGPVPQTISSTQSLIHTTESSFSNTNTREHNWQVGGSLNVQIGSINNMYSANIGFNWNVGKSFSTSTTYGSSTINTEESMHTLSAEVPPYSKITATLMAFSSRREIPYTADVELIYESGDRQRLVTRGVLSQVKTDSIIVTYSDAVPVD